MRYKEKEYKGNAERWILKSLDEVKLILEDQLANL